MKYTIIFWSIAWGAMLMCVLLIPTHNQKTQQKVDLPKEYKQLSHNSAKPDTVLAFYDNDIVYIEFKPKTH